MSLNIALPKGRLLNSTATLLERAGWELDGYNDKLRYYRLKSGKFPDINIKVLQEKDIPIQIAVGNYDLGICGLDWTEELLVKYPSSSVIKIADLGYGDGALYVAALPGELADPEKLTLRKNITRIAGEYPNLAEILAGKLRLKRFSIFPLWGGAEVYPPEDAEIVLLPRKSEKDILDAGLVPIIKVVDFKAYLIANSNSLKTKNMADVLSSLTDLLDSSRDFPKTFHVIKTTDIASAKSFTTVNDDMVRLALPDGHQQSHVCRIFDKVGIKVDDYPSQTGNRRPTSNLAGYFIKVIRPQDMPLQIANGNFDLAITGRDWLIDHKYQFPNSPIHELLDLKYGWVKIVAVVDEKLPVEDIASWWQHCNEKQITCRVATEYTNIADRYVRDNRIDRYRIIPTWGATEGFLPEDADLLIENTETGGTIARHNLRIIDKLFESTACLIASTRKVSNTKKSERMEFLIDALKNAMEMP
ncbi:MAG: ATP phosphoribosyltransferase [Dehalococcoidales bacterium]|nr:ATP phosphoribosyltransferase [Dehalococcoidales bacterium]